MLSLYRDYRRVEDYPKYIVSNYGEVYSLWFDKIKKMKTLINRDGYMYIFMSNNNIKSKHKTIHSIVGNAFIGKRINDLTFDHIDRNKKNNRADNLRLATRSEQSINRRTPKNNKLSEKNICIELKGVNYYYDISIKKNHKTIFRKRLNINKYTLEDAIKVRDDFLRIENFV